MKHTRHLQAFWALSCILGLLLGCAAYTPAQASTPELALLDQANRAFEHALNANTPQKAQGHYQQAIEAYEQLLASGRENAKLHYNLGNTYFRRHDLGRAIAHYRRGLRLEPGNERLRANLRYARSQRRDQIEYAPDVQQALLTRVLFWLDDLSLYTQVTIALASFVCFWLCASLHLFWHRAVFRWLMAGTICLFLLFAASTVVVHRRNTSQHHGVIVAQEAAVRKGNGDSYALQFPQPLHSGAEFTVLEERGTWLHIHLANGADGWIRQAHVTVW